MSDHGELEIWLDRGPSGAYTIQLNFRQAGSEADRVMPAAPARLDLAELASQSLDVAAYGQQLEQIFAEAEVRKEFDSVRAVCEAADVPLRIRLHIGPGAPELHGIRWETLADARSGQPMLVQEQFHFSRYLTSHDWRPVKLRPRAELSALVAIASPTDLDQYPALAAIDAEGVAGRIQSSLAGIPATFLTGPGEATLDNIINALGQGHDILFLVAHGALVRGDPYLWLVKPGGETDRVIGSDLLDRLRELPEPPSLAVLTSCQSAGTGDSPLPNDSSGAREWGSLSSLGPLLSSAGIPSVMALQGNFSMETETTFMPAFFQQLASDGRIDRAMSLARARVKDRPDWWMPVLFTRLRGGRIWYQQGFGEVGDAQDKWPALVRHIQRSSGGGGEGGGGRRRGRRRRRQEGGCTPLIGPGLLEPYVGRLQEIASYWANQQGFPLAHHETEQLARIAQFIDVKVEQRWLHNELERHLCHQLVKRHGTRVPAAMQREMEQDPFLGDALVEVARARDKEGALNGHKVLAELNLPLYLCTTPDNLLSDTLKEQGKEPMVDICRWNEDLVHDRDPVFEPLGDHRPTPDQPVVFHLFGNLDDPNSLVLSEDDHFDFLTGFFRFKDHIPGVVRAAMATTALMFVGFRIDDWTFRVLFRAIMNQEGLAMSDRLSHIAAQIEPEEGRLIDPEGTRKFLSKLMGGANISLYWGDVDVFLKDLNKEIGKEGAA